MSGQVDFAPRKIPGPCPPKLRKLSSAREWELCSDAKILRRGRESNPRIRLLQSHALPLGYHATRFLFSFLIPSKTSPPPPSFLHFHLPQSGSSEQDESASFDSTYVV